MVSYVSFYLGCTLFIYPKDPVTKETPNNSCIIQHFVHKITSLCVAFTCLCNVCPSDTRLTDLRDQAQVGVLTQALINCAGMKRDHGVNLNPGKNLPSLPLHIFTVGKNQSHCSKGKYEKIKAQCSLW